MLSPRLVWPVALLFAATLWFVFEKIVETGDAANALAVHRQRGQLALALEQHLNARLELIAEAAARTLADAGASALKDRLGALAGSLTASGQLDALAILDPDARSLLTSLSPGAGGGEADFKAEGSVQADARLALERLGGDIPANAIEAVRAMRAAALRKLSVRDGKLSTEFFIPVQLPIAIGSDPDSQGGSLVLFGRKALGEGELARIGTALGLSQLRLREGRPDDEPASLIVPGAEGHGASRLSWSSERPGDVMREMLIPLTLAGFSLIVALFGLVAGYLLWVSNDLAKTEAHSRNLLGRDPLSGLANRLLFSERLDRELALLPQGGAGLAVHFVDLDRFKDVNDTYGHQAGDDLIQLVAQRLMHTLRSVDVIARFGGDEFAIIQTNVNGPEDAAALARRVLDALTSPFTVAQTEVIVGASIGIALAPQHGDGREMLMRLADTALYQSKSEGRNRYSFFQSRMDTTLQMRKTVEDDLRRAIADDQLVLHYQPLYSSDGAQVVALEALVRWPHPTRGLISPADFIPIAEERGLVIPLGEWVLRTACRDGLRWPGMRMAVNVSPIQFRHRDFVAGVMALLEETGFDPHRLELELTEGVVVEDADAAENAMMELRAMGVHLALDDFGTGYSSLIYLRRFAFDTIKIDRSFLESMEATGESAILVHSMVHLGRALGLTVTAEGVETPEQHRFLQALGCHQLQGFLFSKPLPAEEIDRLLAGQNVASAA